MKKFLLTLLAAFMGLAAFAQHKCRLSVTLEKPVQGAYIHANQAFAFVFRITNNGPDTLLKTDTIVGFALLNTTTYGIGALPLSKNLAPGDTEQFSYPNGISISSSGNPLNIGEAVFLYNNKKDSARDSMTNLTITYNGKPYRGHFDSHQTTFTTVGIDPVLGPSGAMEVYPNPALTSTTFSYSTSANEHVRLSIYDVTGKEIANPIDENQGEGNHAFIYNTAGLTPGIYIYRLNVGAKVTNGKLIIGQ